MANRGLVKSYTAEAAIGPCIIVKPGANDYGVAPGAAATDKVFGVTVPNVTAAIGESVDVIHMGIADVKLGGTVARGDLITSDASGQGVSAAPAAGVNNRHVGVVLISGVSGDIVPVLINPSSLQG